MFLQINTSADTIRPEAHMFCSSLNYMACSVAMLTGDHKDVATEVSPGVYTAKVSIMLLTLSHITDLQGVKNF